MSEPGNNMLKFGQLPLQSGAIGAVVVAVCVAGGFSDRNQFFQSYLVAFLFWIGITLGCLALLMVQHLTGGNWALMIRRILEAGSRTLPLMAVAAIPLGGFVRFLDEREVEEGQVISVADSDRAFNRQKVWKRLVIVAAGPFANLLLAVLLYAGLYVNGVDGLRAVLAAPPAATCRCAGRRSRSTRAGGC